VLFNSHAFLFLFLPIVWLVATGLRKAGWARVSLNWLLLASLFFYGWWAPENLLLIAVSTLANFWVGSLLGKHRSRWLLALGVGGNLGLIGHFKYQAFFTEVLNTLSGAELSVVAVVLPLGVSFFTFIQIAYLVDVYRGDAPERSLSRYALFVTFFPHLIAGPIVHLKALMPEFDRPSGRTEISKNLSVGLSIFAVGLAKKVLIADSLAPLASPTFAAFANGDPITSSAAWMAALAYSGQLYFDFSGYSDMAIGLARLFGVRFPINFFSPYKALSLTDFWRRWHITLSAFLRDYLYVPLGGNRRGRARTYVNLLLTMLLGGLWHGANWTFVLWGLAHGVGLALERAFGIDKVTRYRHLRMACTFLLVMLGWVLFRSATLDSALAFYAALFSFDPTSWSVALVKPLDVLLIAAALAIAFFAPNTSELFARVEPGIVPEHFELRPSRATFQLAPAHGIALGLLFGLSVLGMSRVTEFIYFQF